MAGSADLVTRHHLAIETAIREACARWRVHGPDSEDLSQHLWCLILQDNARVLRQFEGRSAMTSYLFPVVMRATGKWLDRRTKQRHVELSSGDTYAMFADASVLADNNEEDDGIVAPLGWHRRFEEAVTALRRLDRLLIRMRCEGATIAGIASALGLSSKAVERRMSRVLIRLRRILEGSGSRPGPAAHRQGRQAGRQAGRQVRQRAKPEHVSGLPRGQVCVVI